MYEKTAFGAWLVVLMFLCTTAFASASPPVVLPSPDYLTKEQYSFYNKTLDCNSPTAIAPYVWNYSDYYSDKEQCELYKQAAKIMQPKTYEFKIPLPEVKYKVNVRVTNVTVIKP
jgi:hypothetical protein